LDPTSAIAINPWHPLMTWSFFLTAVIVPAVGWLIVMFIKRSIKNSDDLAETRAQMVRHSLDALNEHFETLHKNMEKKIESFCEDNREEHKALREHHQHHSHNDKGKVIFTG
jgi:t-SNARE complex subunit (syntaxin)